MRISVVTGLLSAFFSAVAIAGMSGSGYDNPAKAAASGGGNPVGDALKLVLVVGNPASPKVFEKKSWTRPKACPLVATDWDATLGTMRRFERAAPGGAWKQVGTATTISFGLCGLAWGRGLHGANLGDDGGLKHEGDLRSPAGVFRLGTTFGFADQPPGGAATIGDKLADGAYMKLNRNIQCVEDAASSKYNEIVDRSTSVVDWKGDDRMGDQATRGKLFKWGVVVGHNTDNPVAGAGSCVFIHIWRAQGQGTAACTAGSEDDIADLVGWLNGDEKPAVMVQLPASEYARFKGGWKLP